MKTLIATILSISTCLSAQSQAYALDTLDFFLHLHVRITNPGTQDTLLAHSLDYQTVTRRFGTPGSVEYVEQGPFLDEHYQVRYGECQLVIPEEGPSDFMFSSDDLVVVLYKSFGVAVGDSISAVSALFPQAASKIATLNGEGVLYIPYLMDHNGQYRVTDNGITFVYDLQTGQIVRIIDSLY